MNNGDLQRLHDSQMREFELARRNFDGLRQVVYRDIDFGAFSVRVQYNPARMLSTNAKVDRQTLQSRPCFLCGEHLPEGQRGIAYGEGYHIFVNPYPIFPRHFTVPADAHIPQQIDAHIGTLLRLASDFTDYVVFYNGPECGASAPDHFHFQMVPRQSMPLEQDIRREELRKTVVRKEGCSVSVLENYLREVVVLRASRWQDLSEWFVRVRDGVGRLVPFQEEPMMNVLAWYEDGWWTLCLFLRKLRRPRQFFAEGEEKILFSPGCVDMAGVIVAPRKEDFDRYSVPLLTDLFGQVSATPEVRDALIQELEKISL